MMKDVLKGFIQVDLSKDNNYFSLFQHEILKVLSELLLQYSEYHTKSKLTLEYQDRLHQIFLEMVNAVVKI